MRSLTMKVLLAAGLFILALFLASCGGGGTAEAGSPLPPPPAITVSVSPPSVTVLTGATQQFTATVSGSPNTSVSWTIDGAGSGNATVGTISGSGLYTAPLIPPSPSNTVTVRATSVADSTKSGTASLAVNNPQPTLTSISPATVDAGSGDLTLTVNGSGFNALSVVRLAGTNLSTSFLSSSQLMAQIPASLLTTGGMFGVTVSNPAPGGGTSNSNNLQVLLVVGVSPGSANLLTGSTQQFTSSVTGGANSVTWSVNDSAGGNETVGTIDANGLYTAPVVPPAPNTVTIKATSNADTNRSASASVTVSNPAPAITSISPTSVNAGSGDTVLTVNGSGFNALSAAQLAGTNLSTSFLNSSQLTAQIPASLLTTEGTFGVTVSNPAPGGGTSNPENFVVVAPTPPPTPPSPTRVSGDSPFPLGCEQTFQGNSSINYQNAEVEPWLVIDPTDPAHLVGVWQQDRWNNGGAHGLMTGVSRDGGQTWQRSFVPFSRCASGDALNGGDYDRASDPWITASSDGVLYQMALAVNWFTPEQALLVSRSTDGGDTWSAPATVAFDASFAFVLDKPSITADPYQAGFVYAVWTRYEYTDSTESVLINAPTWLARTTDGGTTWDAPQIIHNPPLGDADTGGEVVVLPDGTLVVFFGQYTDTPLWPPPDAKLLVIRSSDQGVTWSPPIQIDVSKDIGVTDVETGEAVRAGAYQITVDGSTGALYLVWMDARFSGGLRNGIAFSTSTDGGLTWSPAVQVNQAPNVQAFAPSIAVGQGGKIAINYYDFRMDTSDPNTLLTNYWQITSSDGGQTWQEIPLSPSFDMRSAPWTSLGYMVTDYEGLVPMGDSFYSLFAATNSGDASNPTDIFGVSSAAVKSVAQLQTMNNGRVEINLHPRTARELIRLRLERRRTGPPE